ncbi:uncharacterized protein LOC126837452 isoform X2 [Adelges cooleyi]|uniref:uncharacterized protein LOC126837452 isoform X2 n=1 Tax=Adelges cooleyi TaxID=133065 RepID=UPI00217FC4DC|nr:uncharacterized protein LOC126837452 isoform X2 [Adelges cooleyi]
MITLYILISFALTNVSAALDEYKEHVLMTNHQIMHTRDKFLYSIIEEAVLSRKFTMAELVLMFVVPEVKNKDIAEYIEQHKENPIENYTYHKKIEYQKFVHEKLRASTSDVTPMSEENCVEHGELLKNLEKRRRMMTMKSTALLIHHVKTGENARFGQFSDICNLIGLYKSLEYPKKFIRQAKVDRYGVCSLTDINGVVSTYFSIKDLYIIPVFNTYSMNTYF